VAAVLARFLDGSDSDAGLIHELGNTLAALLGVLLGGDERWSSRWWVDDTLSDRVDRLNRDTVETSGVAITADERQQWIEPYRAVLQLGPSRDRLASYRVSLGDAETGLAAVPYGGRRPKTWPEPSSWVFTFGRGGDQPAE
jgi:hypothetical protein